MCETKTALPYSLMGILNLTGNSFVESSRALGLNDDELVGQVQFMFDSGADIIDVGACSTAPGNTPVDEATEWSRLERPLRVLFEAFPDRPFSLDSFRLPVLSKALALGKSFIINDISGAKDEGVLDFAASNGLDYIAMDSSADPYSFFVDFADRAERKSLENWILDPGFGFGKTVEKNWEILSSLRRFTAFGKPVLAALSRKRMIYQPLGLTPENCAPQSVKAELLAVINGASIIRTHDLTLHSCGTVLDSAYF